MLIFEFSEENKAIFEELEEAFPDCEVIEANSFGADTVVQVLIPVASILAASPVINKLLDKLFEDTSITVKFDGVELSGGTKKVRAMIREIKSMQELNTNVEDDE